MFFTIFILFFSYFYRLFVTHNEEKSCVKRPHIIVKGSNHAERMLIKVVGNVCKNGAGSIFRCVVADMRERVSNSR